MRDFETLQKINRYKNSSLKLTLGLQSLQPGLRPSALSLPPLALAVPMPPHIISVGNYPVAFLFYAELKNPPRVFEFKLTSFIVF